MMVRDVIQGHNQVHTCDADGPVSAAVDTLAKTGVRCLVAVGENHDPVGILSVKDVIGGLAREGADAMGQPVRAYMSKGLITVAPTDTLEEVEQTIARQAIHHLPVVKDGKLVGLVTTADVLQEHLREKDGVNRDLVTYISCYPG